MTHILFNIEYMENNEGAIGKIKNLFKKKPTKYELGETRIRDEFFASAHSKNPMTVKEFSWRSKENLKNWSKKDEKRWIKSLGPGPGPGRV